MTDRWHRTCLRCGGEMEEGFVLDEGYGEKKPARWIAGPPERSIWGNVKLRGRRQLPLSVFRCL